MQAIIILHISSHTKPSLHHKMHWTGVNCLHLSPAPNTMNLELAKAFDILQRAVHHKFIFWSMSSSYVHDKNLEIYLSPNILPLLCANMFTIVHILRILERFSITLQLKTKKNLRKKRVLNLKLTCDHINASKSTSSSLIIFLYPGANS